MLWAVQKARRQIACRHFAGYEAGRIGGLSKPNVMTREEIEHALAREFAETHNPEIPEEIYTLASQLLEKPVQFSTTLG
jgi:hypothetical protein